MWQMVVENGEQCEKKKKKRNTHDGQCRSSGLGGLRRKADKQQIKPVVGYRMCAWACDMCIVNIRNF